MRDLADKFVIAARGRHFHSLHVDRPTDQHFELDVDAPDSNPGDIDVRKGVVDEVWAPFHRPGVEAIQGSIASVPANVSLDMRSSDDPAKKELTYTADDTAASFNLESSSVHSGGDVEIGYMNDFLNDHMPYVFSPSAFDTSQTLSLNPMPKFFHVCQIATGNDCTSDVFTPGMFDEFNPNSSANGGSIRFQADPRAHFSFHDSSPKVTDFWYNRINYEPPNGCQAGEQPGPNTPSGSDPLDCEGKDVAPGRATSDIELDLNNLAIQTHQEDAGFVGEVVGYPDQGYIALDTGWESDYVSCTDALVETGWDPGDASAFCANPAAANIHGHHAPPPEQRVSGEIEKAGGFAESVDDLSNANDFDRLPTPIVDGVDLEFGDKLGLDHRIFEYDPDELIFAKTYNGHSYCQDDTHLEGNGNDFTGLFCEGDEAILLP
jgi:hypothetical protein